MAVVDDSGRLLELCDFADDAAGYGVITALLAERFGGAASLLLASDSDEHLVVSLLAASGRWIAYTDEDSADEYAQQFSSDEDELPRNEATDRRAVGMARAVQAGLLPATVAPTPRELVALKPIIAAHSSLALGRQAAATALREVLRELYPAALRAYPDPAEPVALAMLDALPEPSLLNASNGKSRDTVVTVAARLVSDGVCDNDTALDAVNALRVAINETPKRNGSAKQLGTAISDAVRASVAAVRSADAAVSVLIAALTEKVSPVGRPAGATTTRRRTPPTPITTPPVAPVPVSPAPAFTGAPARPAWAQSTPPPQLPPGFEPTPVTGHPIIPTQRTPEETPFVPTLTTAAINSERAARGLGPVPAPSVEPAAHEPVEALLKSAPLPPPPPQPPLIEPGSRGNWPLVGEAHEELLRPNRITPPWQADDLVMPLSLVEPTSAVAPDPTSVPLRLVDDSALTNRIPKPRRTEHTSMPPREDDTDLLIFSSVSSAWFGAIDGESTWNSGMDSGWRAAEEASLRPSIGGDTTAGLPRRVPSANLVPGSASPSTAAERPLRIVRDAGEIAAHTSGYFNGSRRGSQDAGSYAVGGRPGRESANGWDFARDNDVRDMRDMRDMRGMHDMRDVRMDMRPPMPPDPRGEYREYYDDRGEYGHRAASYR